MCSLEKPHPTVINVDTDNENQEDGDDERPDTPSEMSSSSVKEPSLNR